jgi:hypothetical protein
LKSIEKRDERFNQIQKDWTESMHTFISNNETVIERNSSALKEMASVIHKCQNHSNERNN